MDKAESRFEAAAVEDGIISCVGSNEEVLACAGEAEVIDLAGKTLLPGFNDNHLHLLSYGYSLEVADLNDCKSLEELKRRVKSTSKTTIFRKVSGSRAEAGTKINLTRKRCRPGWIWTKNLPTIMWF